MRLVLLGARGAATGVLLIKVAKTKTYFHVDSVGSFVLLVVRIGKGRRSVQGAPPPLLPPLPPVSEECFLRSLYGVPTVVAHFGSSLTT